MPALHTRRPGAVTEFVLIFPAALFVTARIARERRRLAAARGPEAPHPAKRATATMLRMNAWRMNSYDGIGALTLGELPDPTPAPGEVIIRVAFAALNPADAFLAEKLYPAKPPLPHVLGRDGSGEAVAVGEAVTNVRVGDRVAVLWGNVGVDRRGTLAELVAVPADMVTPVPAGWTTEEGAAAPLVFLTAWQALTMWSEPPAPPAPGSVLVVSGASGGVGVATVLLGKAMGLAVVALTRSAQKGERLKALGADHVLDPTAPDLRKRVAAAIAPKRVELAVDSVGGTLLPEIIGMLGYAGRVSIVGRSGGDVPGFNPSTLLFRRNRLGGVVVGDYTAATAHPTWTAIVESLARLGQRPVIDQVFAFEDVKAAFARLAEGPMGKVVVRLK